MTHAEKYLNDFADLQKEYGAVEITFEGLCEHLERFAYYEQKRVKKLNIDDVGKSLCCKAKMIKHLQYRACSKCGKLHA